MDIQKEILSVIKNQDFIILPEIGAFIFEYSKPYFNEKNQLVESKKTIRFENVITKDPDGKLTKSLSESLSIPINFAEIEYQDFLKNFKKEILLKNKYDWEGFGMFFKSPKGPVEFYPEKKFNEKKQVIPETPKPVKPVEIKTTVTPVVLEANIQKTKNTIEKKNHKQEIYKRNGSSSWLRFLLFLLPIALLSSGLAYNFLKNSPQTSDKQTLVEEIDSLEKVDSSFPVLNEKESGDEIEKKINEKHHDKSAEVSGSTDSSKNEDSNRKSDFTINIGIFKVRENVDNLATYLAENGIPAKVRPNGKKYRVYVTAENEQQAKEFVDKIEQLTGERPVYQ